MLGAETKNPAPYIVSWKKKEQADQEAISKSLQAIRGTPIVLPVFSNGKRVAHVCGDRYLGKNTYVLPESGWSKYYDCTITTYDGIVSAINSGKKFSNLWTKAATTAPVANNWYDMYPVSGYPAAGTYTGAARTAVQFDDTKAGALLHGGNVSTNVKGIINLLGLSSATTPVIVVYDRVLTYEACAFAAGSNQTMTNGVAAQRYISTGDPGLQTILTCQTALGATAANFSQLRGTDNDGNTLQAYSVAANVNVIVSAAAPTANLGARVVSPSASGATITVGPYMTLGTGDTGMRLINDYTTSAANTGTLCFVMGFPLAMIPIQTAGVGVLMDTVMQVASMPTVKDGAFLTFLVYFPAASAATLSGRVEVVWG